LFACFALAPLLAARLALRITAKGATGRALDSSPTLKRT
jgi:hypothetical protein